MNLAAYESKKEICKQLWYGSRFPSEQLNMSTSWQPPSFTTASTYNCLWCTRCPSTGCQEPKRPEGCGKGYSRHLKAKIRILLPIILILPKSSPKKSSQHQSSNTLVKDFRTVTLGSWLSLEDKGFEPFSSSISAWQPMGCLERVQFVHTRHEVFGQKIFLPRLLHCFYSIIVIRTSAFYIKKIEKNKHGVQRKKHQDILRLVTSSNVTSGSGRQTRCNPPPISSFASLAWECTLGYRARRTKNHRKGAQSWAVLPGQCTCVFGDVTSPKLMWGCDIQVKHPWSVDFLRGICFI